MIQLKLFLTIGILLLGIVFSGVVSFSERGSFNEKILHIGEVNNLISYGMKDKYHKIDSQAKKESFQPFPEAGLFYPQ